MAPCTHGTRTLHKPSVLLC